MKLLKGADLIALRRRAVKRLGLIAGGNADGFLVDLQSFLDEEVGLFKVSVKETGDSDCRFRVTALYDGEAEHVAQSILAVLDERIAYSSGESAAAAWSIQDGEIQVSFLTEHDQIGAATVCIEASRRRPLSRQ